MSGIPLASGLPHPDSPAARHIDPHVITKRFKAQQRLKENRTYLAITNVKAFLSAIGQAEGGDYNLKYGGIKGSKNNKWQFSNFSTHPGAGADGKTTAAGMYQINQATWREMGEKMGLHDFSSTTQDLITVEILRTIGAIDNIISGNIDAALSPASRRWAALPEGNEKPGRYPQPYMAYDDFISSYKNYGGDIK